MGIRWLKISKRRNKVRQDTAKMRTMKDVPSVFTFLGGEAGGRVHSRWGGGGGSRCSTEASTEGPRGPMEAPNAAKVAPWSPS